MPSTFVHALLPTACVARHKSSLPRLSKVDWLKFLFIAMILANLPDLDVIPATLFKEHWRLIHRNWGHNLFSIALWILIGTKLLSRFVSREFEGRRGWIISASLVFSHVILDSLGCVNNHGSISGVPLFWPLSEAQFHLPIHVFLSYEIDESKNMLLAHATSLDYWSKAALNELKVSAVAYGCYATMYVGLTQFARRISEIRTGIRINRLETQKIPVESSTKKSASLSSRS